MIITANSEVFMTDFTRYDLVGFHGTSALNTYDIEKYGLLPKKIFTDAEHSSIKTLANELGISIADYDEWLNMRSVSFGTGAQAAINQMNKGFVGGQGLFNMENVLRQILRHGSPEQQSLAQVYLDQISRVRGSSVVIYAVDLSNLGKRVIKDISETLQFYFDPTIPLPPVSPLNPSLIIERLDLK